MSVPTTPGPSVPHTTPDPREAVRTRERLPMRIEALEAYDVEPALIDIWRETIGPRLLPVQERAVKEFGLFGDGNLVVFSPTSSGKTFIGEMAAVKAARANTRVFYLVPQRALADEKFREFRTRYAPVGIDVVVSSRDHREYDGQIRERAFEIAIVVFEKLRALLVSQPNLLNDVGLVVVDELQMLTDPERGPTLELLLTKLLTAHKQPRLIGLSAVLGKANTLTEWLGAKLLMDERRPVELRKGVLCQGEYRYREHNSGRVGAEEFRICDSKDRNELLLCAAEDILERGEQVLLFVPDRAAAVGLARVLAQRVRLPCADVALEEIKEAEDTHMRDALGETLRSSVAFHHADMTGDEREIIERAFRLGQLRALVATTTLAMGVNLPARNVVLDGRKWITNGRYDRPYLDDLSKSEYENMSGRAGRLAFTQDFGRSVMVTHSRFQAEAWLDSYIGRDFEDINPTLKDDRLEDLVLDLVASGMARTRNQLTDLLLASFTGRVHWTEQVGRAKFVEAVSAALATCGEGGLVRESARGNLVATKVGKVAAGRSIGVETASAFARWAKTAHAAPAAPLEVLVLLGQTLAGGGVHVRYTWREDRETDYKSELIGQVDRAGLRERAVFEPYTSSQMALEDDQAKAVKKALVLQDWIEEVPTRAIERRYETWAGSLRRIGEEYGWLCEGLAAICGACGWKIGWRRAIESLGQRLTFGVKEDAIALMQLRVPRLGRALAPRFRDAGLIDPEEIQRLGPAGVRKAVGQRRIVEMLFARLCDGSAVVAPAEPGAGAQGSLLVDRGASPHQTRPTAAASASATGLSAGTDNSAAAPASTVEHDLIIDVPRRRVRLWSIELPAKGPGKLQPQLFLALTALALRAGEVVSMADIAEDLQRLGRLPRKPIAPEARDVRYRILRALKAAAPKGPTTSPVDALIENVSGFGLRLNCTALVVRGLDELVR